MKNQQYHDEEINIPDESDSNFKREMFQNFKDMGIKPEQVKEEGSRKEYEDWLKIDHK